MTPLPFIVGILVLWMFIALFTLRSKVKQSGKQAPSMEWALLHPFSSKNPYKSSALQVIISFMLMVLLLLVRAII